MKEHVYAMWGSNSMAGKCSPFLIRNPFKRIPASLLHTETMYNMTTLENPLLRWMFVKKHGIDESYIDTTLEYREAEDNLRKKHPETQRQGGDFSVNTSLHSYQAELSKRMRQCVYCGSEFESERNTAKYCRPSHRVLMFRRLKRQRKALKISVTNETMLVDNVT
jgi:hypothetical protein